MSDRRPPSKPSKSGTHQSSRSSARRGHERDIHEERTELAPRSAIRAPGESRDGYDIGQEATSTIHQIGSDDISLIDADDRGPAPSDSGFKVPPHERLHVAPPGAIDGASFGDVHSTTNDVRGVQTLSTDSLKSGERPVKVRKWRLGAESDPDGSASASKKSSSQRGRAGAVPLPDAPAPNVEELRRTLHDAERLLRAANLQLSAREAPEAKAQITAALHRVVEALALLPRR